MMNGNISNVSAPYIYIHIDDLLFITETMRFKKIFGIKIPLPDKQKINFQFLRMLYRIHDKYNFNVVLFSLNYSEDDRKWLEELLFKEHFIYNQLEFHSDIESLRHARYIYLFSKNEAMVSMLSRKEAFTFNEIGEKLHV